MPKEVNVDYMNLLCNCAFYRKKEAGVEKKKKQH